MKIELKSIKVNDNLSEETTCFTANLHINGIKAAYVKNDGRGGCTDYHALEGKNDLLKKVEEYAKTLPDVKLTETLIVKSDLEMVIEQLLSKYLKSIEEKKMQKLMETKIVYGKRDSGIYAYVGFKGTNAKLSEISKKSVDSLVASVKARLKDGEEIFNTNI